MALTIPALVAERIAAHGNETVLRKKDRGIWQAVSWTQLGSNVADVSRGLATIGFAAGDVACVLAETRPDYVYVDLGILDVGGVSGGIHPATEPEQLGEALQQCRCSVLFVENEEQLDKALLVRDRCPELQRIVIFDMKGLREFSDATCESYRAFIARGAEHRTNSIAVITEDQPAILLLPQGRLLTHGDVLHLLAQAPFAASTTRPRRAPCAAADVQRDGTCVRALPGAGRAGDQQLPGKPRYGAGEPPGGSAHIARCRYAALAAPLHARDRRRRRSDHVCNAACTAGRSVPVAACSPGFVY